MALIWGILGIAFVRFAFPALAKFLSKLHTKPWRWICIILSVFMAINLLVSGAAILRWHSRLEGNTQADNVYVQYLDEHFDNDTMAKKFPNMVFMNELPANQGKESHPAKGRRQDRTCFSAQNPKQGKALLSNIGQKIVFNKT